MGELSEELLRKIGEQIDRDIAAEIERLWPPPAPTTYPPRSRPLVNYRGVVDIKCP